MKNLLSQVASPVGSPLRGIGTLGLEGDPSGGGAGGVFNKFISNTIGILTAVAGVWFIFVVFAGAFGIMTAGSDKGKMESSRQKLTTGIIGLTAVVAAIFLIRLIGGLLGLESILDPAAFIETLQP